MKRLRARDNPLATHRLENLKFRFDACVGPGSWSELMDRLQALGFRAAIVGPEGAGKTTLFLELREVMEARGFEVFIYGLKKHQRRLPLKFWKETLNSNSLILLDGAEQLNWLEWMLLRLRAYRCAGLVVTAHRVGLLPTLVECRTSAPLFQGLVRELTGSRLPQQHIVEAFDRRKGNIRLAFMDLYDQVGSFV